MGEYVLLRGVLTIPTVIEVEKAATDPARQ